jgi:hypothetical protein
MRSSHVLLSVTRVAYFDNHSVGTLHFVQSDRQCCVLRFAFPFCLSERRRHRCRSEESQSNASLLRLFASLRVTRKDVIPSIRSGQNLVGSSL